MAASIGTKGLNLTAVEQYSGNLYSSLDANLSIDKAATYTAVFKLMNTSQQAQLILGLSVGLLLAYWS